MGRVGEVVGDGTTRGIRVDTGEVAMMSVGLLKDAISALTNDRGVPGLQYAAATAGIST